ncbi:VanZ family protein [Deinococcus sp.]|uniref:VanZ family protein n=1 Tax=Deinococcus sp. TaxID=47478 RepID=UPI003C7DD459
MTAVIWLFGSSLLGPPLPRPVSWLGRALEYLALGYALGRASGRRGLALGLTAWFGAADEVHLAFLAGQGAGIENWLFALLGAWLGGRLALSPLRGRSAVEPAPRVE